MNTTTSTMDLIVERLPVDARVVPTHVVPPFPSETSGNREDGLAHVRMFPRRAMW